MKPVYRLLSLASLSLALVGCTTSQTLLHQVGLAPLPDRVAQKLYGPPPSAYYAPEYYTRRPAPNYTGANYARSKRAVIPNITGIVPGAENLPPPEDPNFPQAFERLMREDDAQFAANHGVQPMWGSQKQPVAAPQPIIINQTPSGYSALGY